MDIKQAVKDKYGRTARNTLFERFGIKKISMEDLDHVKIIGMDFGDGECCAAYIGRFSDITDTNAIKLLFPENTKSTHKMPNIVAISDNPKDMPDWIEELKNVHSKGDVPKNYYYNFKTCPGWDKIYSRYVFDSTDEESEEADDNTTESNVSIYSYGDVMKIAFACQLNQYMHENDTELCSGIDRLVILVGRPTAEDWAESELEYRDLLMEGVREFAERDFPDSGRENVIKKFLKTGTIEIAIAAESNAAFSYESNPGKLQGEKSYINSSFIIIDAGSSTLDITYVVNGKIAGEFSRQFGGGHIDLNMLKKACDELNKTYKDIKFEYPKELKMELRLCKEKHYGRKGKQNTIAVFSPYISYTEDGKPETTNACVHIDKIFMNEVLENMPVEVIYKENTLKYDSWKKGLESILSDARTQFGLNNRIPDNIILTGGLSVMPEVKKSIENIFKKAPVQTSFPNYSVAYGLCYMGNVEVKKQEILERLMEAAEKIMIEKGFYNAVVNSVAKNLADNEYEAADLTLLRWYMYGPVDDSEGTSLMDWQNAYSKADVKYSCSSICAQWWQDNDMTGAINSKLSEELKELFGVPMNFNFALDPYIISELLTNFVTIYRQEYDDILQYINGGGTFVINANKNRVKNKPEGFHVTKSRQECYESFKNNDKIKEDLFNKYKQHIENVRVNDIDGSPYYKQFVKDMIKAILEIELSNYVNDITPYYYMNSLNKKGDK